MKNDLRKSKKLLLNKERIAQLRAAELSHVQGGYFTYRPYGCQYGSEVTQYTMCYSDCC